MATWADFNSTKKTPLTLPKKETKATVPTKKTVTKWDKFNETTEKPVVSQPKPTVGGKANTIAGEVVKGIVKPVATMIARPLQLAAQLGGASAEQVDEFTKSKFGDWVAPVPKNYADVQKDIGRGIQTALTGGLGGAAVGAAKGAIPLGRAAGLAAAEGAGFGVGASLEQGNKFISKDTGSQALIGAGLGAALPVIGSGIGKALGKGKKAVQEVAEEVPAVTPALETGTRQLPVTNLPPIVRRGTARSGQVPAQLFPEQKVPLEPYTPESELPTIPFGKQAKDSVPTVQPGKTPPNVAGPVAETVIDTPKKSVTKITEQTKKKAYKSFVDEDPEFQSGTFEYFNKRVSEYSKDDIINIAAGRSKAPDDVPATAFYNFAKNLDTLSPEEKKRLAGRFVVRKAGQELGAIERGAGFIYDNDVDVIADAVEQLYQKNVKKQKVTKNTLLRDLTNIECQYE